MLYEVEQKFCLPDSSPLEAWVAGHGGCFEPAIVQVDDYFAHPARDFATTDEALRIRSVGEQNCVTYKGPKIDKTTKTRRELELPLEPGTEGAARFAELLAALGFARVATVRKTRRIAGLKHQGFDVELAFDDVERVGQFCELEISADEQRLDAARTALAELATEIGLADAERRSYLELLLQK